ncbi:predicted protein [Nematostella vectensis]|uniref:CAP-Gly domain-containing protein n=1 Tax=Nematostella vectensis TaxID=45351 RepID=A7S8B7_NEMVE|nr:predicted protein [Nematostella vectensis]|eukprot:XP_001632100.1 predicted protein [Nematostella vectensis]
MGCSSSKIQDLEKQTVIPKNGKLIAQNAASEKWKKEGFSDVDLLQQSTQDRNTSATKKSEVQKFNTGDRVHLRGYIGTVKFVGATELGQGDWVGIEMDKELNQGHNGSYEGIQYFFCKPKHGVFARSALVHALNKSDQEAMENDSQISPHIVLFIQTRMRRYIKYIKKKRLELTSSVDREIDAHVRKTPKDATESIEKLSQYLTAPFEESQRSRAFALYRWITLNVSFDSEGYFGRAEKKECRAESVLVTRSAVSQGFANLFQALCMEADIQARSVDGFAKGYGYCAGDEIQGSKFAHTWNILRTRVGWTICDVTWGSGFLGDDLMFHRQPNAHYFMVTPELAISDHFPLDTKWQLLDAVISKEEFENLIVPSPAIFSSGLRLESHKNCFYQEESDSIVITLRAPKRNMIRGVLKDSSGQTIGPRNMIDVTSGKLKEADFLIPVKVTTHFPEPGEYRVQICLVSAEGQLVPGVEYRVRCSRGVGQNTGGFPHLGTSFNTLGFELIKPLENIATENGRANIVLSCEDRKVTNLKCKLTKVFLDSGDNTLKEQVQDKSMCFVEKRLKLFRIKVNSPQTGTYKLDIFAKKAYANSEYICTYFINAYSGVKSPAGFPYLSEKFSSRGFTLVDKFENIEARDGEASVTLKIPVGVRITGYLKSGEEDLPNMCYTEMKPRDKGAKTYESTVHIHTPRAGVFKVNIFGREANGDTQFVCSYVVKSLKPAGDNPGFPRVSGQLKTWGVELVDQQQNITSPDGKASVKIKTPNDLRIFAELNEINSKKIPGMCLVRDVDEMVTGGNKEMTEKGIKEITKEGIKEITKEGIKDITKEGIKEITKEGIKEIKEGRIREILLHTPAAGFFTLNIFGQKKKDNKKFLCSFRVKATRAASENPGFPLLTNEFHSLGLKLTDQYENLMTNTGRGSITLKTPGSILLRGRLEQDDQHLDEDLCSSEHSKGLTKISFHLPEAGLYKLNMHGHEGSKSEPQFLGSFSVLGTRGLGERAGFPTVREEFRNWGLRLESHKENISVYDGVVVLSVLNPNSVEIEGHLLDSNDNDMTRAWVKRDDQDERMAFHIKLSKRGKYRFQISGSNVAGGEREPLCFYKIYY